MESRLKLETIGDYPRDIKRVKLLQYTYDITIYSSDEK